MNQLPTLIEQVAPRLFTTPLAAYPQAASYDSYLAFILNREAVRAARQVQS